MTEKDFTIGGSEIAAVMGLSRWCSPLKLWAQKRGDLPETDLSEKEAVQLGNELEDFVARKFMRQTGLKVRRYPHTIQHKQYPYMTGHVDRLVEGKNEILECKTCSAWKEKEWQKEEIPAEYILQLNWYLGIKGSAHGYLAVLIGGQKFVIKELSFDGELFNQQVQAAIKFKTMVDDGTAPIACGQDSDILGVLHCQESDEIAVIENEEQQNDYNDMIAYRMECLSHKKEHERQIAEIDAKIEQAIGGRAGINTGRYWVTWNTQVRRSVDTTKLQMDELYDKYSKEKTIRVLRVKLIEKKEG